MTTIHKKKILPFPQLDEAGFLALRWHIEEHPDTPQSKSVERILELLRHLRNGGDELSKAEQLRFTTELRNRVSTYRWVRRVSYTSKGLWASVVPADIEKLLPEDRWEYGAVGDLLDMLQFHGGFSRIGRCADTRCGRWFYAINRSDQKFCSLACKQHHYDSNPERRKQKQAYMREHYWEQKRRAQRADERFKKKTRRSQKTSR